MLGRDPSVEVTLVSRDNFFLYTPMLHEIASCEIDITHIVSPIRTLLRSTTVVIGDVEAIDLTSRRVRVSHGFERHRTNWLRPCRDRAWLDDELLRSARTRSHTR